MNTPKQLGDSSNCEYITYLRYVDYIVVVEAETVYDLRAMLRDLSRASEKVGLKMNMDKRKIVLNVHVVPTPVQIGDSTLEVVPRTNCSVQFGMSNFKKEVNRRIRLGWAAIGIVYHYGYVEAS